MPHARGHGGAQGLQRGQHLGLVVRPAHQCAQVGLHLGQPVRQNPRGELLGTVMNVGDVNNKNTRVYETNLYLPYHSDPSDVVGLLCVRKADFKELLSQHSELYDALLRLNCRRLRLMFNQFEDLNTKPLSARLAKQIIMLAKSYGIEQGEEIRIGLQLAQEDLAQLLGASRQRVNQELKGFEREGAVRVEPTRLVVLSRDKLLAIAER